MTRPLTGRQQQVLAVLMLSWDVYRTFPTVRKIGEMVCLSSPATVYHHLHRLEKLGYLARPMIRREVLVPTEKADFWWIERKRNATWEKDEIWRADRAGLEKVGG